MAPPLSTWALRVLWGSLPLAAGPALGSALDAASHPVRTVASLGLWAGWAIVMAAALVPRPVTLTVVRASAPAALAAVTAAAIGGHASVVGLAAGAAVAVLAMTHDVALTHVNGFAYPNERRYPLRAPAAVLALLPVAEAAVVTGVAAGPLLLAAGRWVPGGVGVVVGLPTAALLLRALHSLSRRWVVFVPAGVVLHDPLTLADPFLFRRTQVRALRPAPADSDALDLTLAAPGLALELTLTEQVPLVLARPGGRVGETRSTAALLFTPARPGAVLAEARARRVPVA